MRSRGRRIPAVVVANAFDASIPKGNEGNASCQDGNDSPEAEDDGDGEQDGRRDLNPRVG